MSCPFPPPPPTGCSPPASLPHRHLSGSPSGANSCAYPVRYLGNGRPTPRTIHTAVFLPQVTDFAGLDAGCVRSHRGVGPMMRGDCERRASYRPPANVVRSRAGFEPNRTARVASNDRECLRFARRQAGVDAPPRYDALRESVADHRPTSGDRVVSGRLSAPGRTCWRQQPTKLHSPSQTHTSPHPKKKVLLRGKRTVWKIGVATSTVRSLRA